MSAQMLLSQPLVDAIYDEVKRNVAAYNMPVHVRGIIVGQDPASIAYQNIKEQACIACGITYSRATFAADIDQKSLINHIQSMNRDNDLTGIIIQLPLPAHLDRDAVLGTVIPQKDIDAFHYTLSPKSRHTDIRPPTPDAMLRLFDLTKKSLKNKTVVVIGNGLLVGQPLVLMLRERGVEPIVIDSSTEKSKAIIKSADVLFTGVGQANLVTPDMIKPGVIIIDAGYARLNGKTYGDVDPLCRERASYMTPPIGGVGPLTVACLMQNAFELATALKGAQ